MKTIYLVVVSTDDGRDESVVCACHDENTATTLAARAYGRVEPVPCIDLDGEDDE